MYWIEFEWACVFCYNTYRIDKGICKVLNGSNDKANDNNDFYNTLCTKGISLIHNHSNDSHNSGNDDQDILDNEGAYSNNGDLLEVAFLIHNNYHSHMEISLIHNHSNDSHNSGNDGQDILDNEGAYSNNGDLLEVAFLIHNNYHSHMGIFLIHNHSSGNHSSGNDISGSDGTYNQENDSNCGVWADVCLIHYHSNKDVYLIHNHSKKGVYLIHNHSSGNGNDDILGNELACNKDGNNDGKGL